MSVESTGKFSNQKCVRFQTKHTDFNYLDDDMAGSTNIL